MGFGAILLIIILVAFGLFVGFLVMMNGVITKNQAKLAASIAQLTERFGTGDYHATLPECRCIGIAWDQEQLVMGDDPDRAIGIPFDDIRGAEIEIDGVDVTTSRSTTSSNRGSQLVGGVIGAAALGPVGLLAGGLSGSSTTTGTAIGERKINTVKLVVRVADRAAPLRKYSFYDAGYGEGYSAANPIGKIIRR
ncbi:hypothetical protein ASG67_11760 [Sphingomonas sp. Leaf339]|uniref:hypothetical protein n=1 Tax=Sphingomonas sp. Leaf339 TaxID=1736343 RepID=UPI0006FFCBAB|nr:hypothetical protein [Sphingomonas sp. Leaf339]KQU49769.1 hypothetical protein ASG67_11760 [Sphingomonas sp. Leaf339]